MSQKGLSQILPLLPNAGAQIMALSFHPALKATAFASGGSLDLTRNQQGENTMTQISIKTKSYARNGNYLKITSTLVREGYHFTISTGTFTSATGGVTIITNARRNFVDRIDFTRSAVQIRG
jgi:hypothetical protein